MYSVLESAKSTNYHAMPGVKISSWSKPSRGEPQKLFIEAEPGSEIPLHTHSVDAEMLVVDGQAELLFDQQQLSDLDIQLDRIQVGAGDRILFKANLSHGFKVGPKGLKFVSINDGIAAPEADQWDIDFLH